MPPEMHYHDSANRLADAQGELCIIYLVKGDERFFFTYRDDAAGRALAWSTFGRFAADPELRFNWRDASVLARKVRRT